MARTERLLVALALAGAIASPVTAQQTGVGVVDTAAARARAAVDSVAVRQAAVDSALPNAQQAENLPPADPGIAPPRPMPQGPPISADEVTLVFDREVYRYDAAGRRDPFRPLTDQNAAGPLFEDLTLRMILHSNVPGQSIAVLADAAKRVYRLRRGETIGNITVIDITPERVVFAVEDFGIRRQEVLSMKNENNSEGA